MVEILGASQILMPNNCPEINLYSLIVLIRGTVNFVNGKESSHFAEGESILPVSLIVMRQVCQYRY